jgi:hypothetical protein
MSATPAGTSTRPGRSMTRPTMQRLTTETKHSSKTSELFAFIAVVIGILAAAALIKGGDSGGTDEFIARQAWLYVSIVTAAYLVSRGLAKSGSSDPYTADARDHDGDGSDRI